MNPESIATVFNVSWRTQEGARLSKNVDLLEPDNAPGNAHRELVEQLARLTTAEDEYEASLDLQDRYDDADDYQSDWDAERLYGETSALHYFVEKARALVGQPQPQED